MPITRKIFIILALSILSLLLFLIRFLHQSLWFAPRNSNHNQGGPGFYYGFPHTPDGSGGPGLKAALHCPGALTTAAAAQREPLPADADEIRAPAVPNGMKWNYNPQTGVAEVAH
jgi:hypothetical protein